ncbi:MAG: SDR family NAD(P)-dependent oxidoreductase, partial [Thiobacillus sp.]|nr:SDR family NAD(P)-dependent oxidoreductase [Thiobacillus sp.]
MQRADTYRHILITGASQGLGAALALAYAGPGVRLALAGRDAGRLAAVAERCRQRGAVVVEQCLDITATEPLRQWVAGIDRDQPLDLVIANAGITSTVAPGGPAEDWPRLRQVFDTNLYGALATIEPAVAAMTRRGRGQIALMSSLGGYVGMPVSPAYNASKAALKVYGEGLRGLL